jgi:ribosome modulation factor
MTTQTTTDAYEQGYYAGVTGEPAVCPYGSVIYAADGINPTAESRPAYEWWQGFKDAHAPRHPSV